MKGHLTPEQFSDEVAGFANPASCRHLSECAGCRSEVERMQGALANFRSSAQEWSARTMPPTVIRLPVHSSPWFNQFRALAAVVMLAVAVLAGLLFRQSESVRGRQPVISDAALLEQIDSQVSRKVPAHLEPLLDLVAQDGSTGGN